MLRLAAGTLAAARRAMKVSLASLASLAADTLAEQEPKVAAHTPQMQALA